MVGIIAVAVMIALVAIAAGRAQTAPAVRVFDDLTRELATLSNDVRRVRATHGDTRIAQAIVRDYNAIDYSYARLRASDTAQAAALLLHVRKLADQIGEYNRLALAGLAA